MRKLDINNLEKIEISPEIINKFRISIISETLKDVYFGVGDTHLKSKESKRLQSRKVFVDYLSRNADIEVLSLETKDSDAIIIKEIKKAMVKYLNTHYFCKEYTGVIVNMIIMQSDGCYHTEPNRIIFIKDEIADKDIINIIYGNDSKIFAETFSRKTINITTEDFVDIGMLY